MAHPQLSLSGAADNLSPVANIADARRDRARTTEIADWIVAHVPWTTAVTECQAFHDRWPLLSRDELVAVEDELCRRSAALDEKDADLDAIADSLTGRQSCWIAAADWLTQNPGAGISSFEFFRLFSQLSRAELILAAIEHRRRLICQL